MIIVVGKSETEIRKNVLVIRFTVYRLCHLVDQKLVDQSHLPEREEEREIKLLTLSHLALQRNNG